MGSEDLIRRRSEEATGDLLLVFTNSLRAYLYWTSEGASSPNSFMRPASSCRSGPSDMPSALQEGVVSLLFACSLTTASLINIMGFHSCKNLHQLPLCLHIAVSQACCWLTSHWQNVLKHVSCLAFTSWFQNESCINANSWNRSALRLGLMPYHWFE